MYYSARITLLKSWKLSNVYMYFENMALVLKKIKLFGLLNSILHFFHLHQSFIFISIFFILYFILSSVLVILLLFSFSFIIHYHNYFHIYVIIQWIDCILSINILPFLVCHFFFIESRCRCKNINNVRRTRG